MTHTPDDNSTFTTHLNLEKAPNGSFEDTWDALVNDNLDLIDAGIANAPVIVMEGLNRSTGAIGTNKVVYGIGGGMWSLASASIADIMTAPLGITLSATTAGGQSIAVQVAGPITISGFTDSSYGAPVYVGTISGEVGISPGQYARVLGENIGGNRILLNQSPAPVAATHAASHGPAGGDPLKLDALAAPTDTTDLDASTSAHGLLKKLPNNGALYLSGTGSFTDPRKVGYYEIATSGTASATAGLILVDATAGAVAVTLPDAEASNYWRVTIKKIDPSANAVTITAAGTDLIDGAATKVLATQYASCTIIAAWTDLAEEYGWIIE